jgi:ABC-type multidrug transport system fused ATPase/permease subunit
LSDQEIQQALVDMGFMTNILQTLRATVTEDPLAQDLTLLRGTASSGPSSLEFQNVSFVYRHSIEGDEESAEPLLSNISFKIEKGQNVAIVGPSGSGKCPFPSPPLSRQVRSDVELAMVGKSTTLKLITRLLDASSGRILIDGIDTKHVTLSSLRRTVAVVPQDTCLFDDSIRYNLLYGAQDASEERLREAVESSNLAATIEKLEAQALQKGKGKGKETLGAKWTGLDTVVGERGARLSGGERQKVAIAR